MTKYRVWHDSVIARAVEREMPSCYSEVHHIRPRSLGGGNEPENLVRLTYREHFLVHWLLTKITTGAALRKMQRALLAMTLKGSGERVTAGWQFEAAKRAVRDLELDPAIEAAWLEKYEAAKAAKKEALKAKLLQDMIDKAKLKKRVLTGLNVKDRLNPEMLDDLASEFLHAHKRHSQHRRKGGRKGPFLPIVPGNSREERLLNADAILASALAD